MKRRNVLLFYALLLLLQISHVLEEILGQAWFIDDFYGGLRSFLMVMMLLFLPPVVLFYFILKRKRWALYLGFAYAVIMILDGTDHVIELFGSGAYFGGFRGVGIAGVDADAIGVRSGLSRTFAIPRGYGRSEKRRDRVDHRPQDAP